MGPSRHYGRQLNAFEGLALEFKFDRLLAHFTISPDNDPRLAECEDVRELGTQVTNFPLDKIDESLESYVAALPDRSGLSCDVEEDESGRRLDDEIEDPVER
jgi:hypothetical protein